MEQKMVTVEFNGTRKSILEEKLPEAQKMAEELYKAALKTGYPDSYAKEHFTLRIMKDEQ